MISVLSRYFVMVKELSEETPLATGDGRRVNTNFLPKIWWRVKVETKTVFGSPFTSPLFDLFIVYLNLCIDQMCIHVPYQPTTDMFLEISCQLQAHLQAHRWPAAQAVGVHPWSDYSKTFQVHAVHVNMPMTIGFKRKVRCFRPWRCLKTLLVVRVLYVILDELKWLKIVRGANNGARKYIVASEK